MALPLLGAALQSAWGASGTSGADKTPNVSPGLDPGRYAFELWFNKKRREEDQRERDRLFQENQRQFNVKSDLDRLGVMSSINQADRAGGFKGIETLAAARDQARKAARTGSFVADLMAVSRGS